MAKGTINLKDIGRQRPEAVLDDALQLAINTWASDVITELRQNLTDSKAVASTRLQASIYPIVEADPNSVAVKIYAEDYYKDVDQSQPPGKWPKKSDILEWLKFRPALLASALQKGIKREQLAFLISRKIFKEGDIRFREKRPTLFFTKVFGGLVPQQSSPSLIDLSERVEQALGKSVQIIIFE